MKILLLLAAVSLVGCGGKYESSVSGMVTLDDSPLGPGNVIFTPVNGGNPAIGAIQPNGQYQLKSSRDVGVNTGEYLVSIRVNAPAPPGADPNQRRMTSTLAHPERYTSEATSGLKFAVQAGSNKIDIQLESDSSSN